ncbi:hypothetical protein L211DRAFT_853690 [Terfezia boudieri ATCC MYA-4762]|uniref:DUF6532 domain-containing protein n=1 Tax=Terfezia boudieri ATCC MYA-4762 TaxID=1051890 RepID=A0A3N4LAV7_9PEZI|nr:hypothetical protein L211DRAFT_853690 [Terfezia boudieri ATCC MYA-4762]
MTHKSSNQQAAPPTTTKRSAPTQLRNEISFNDDIDDLDEIDNEGDRSSTESNEDENETSTPTSVLAPSIGKQTRAFAGIPGIHQGITNVTRKIVEQYTLYKKPLLILGRNEVEDGILARRGSVYLQAGKTRLYQKYFDDAKRKGNRKPDFLEKINGVFICFITTAIRYCLKAWKTGECADTHVKIGEIEPTDALQPEDQEKYEAELEKELNHAYDRLNIPESKRKHQRGQLRDSSVEMAEPLQLDLGNIYVDPDQTSNEHSDEEGGENEDESGRRRV